MYKIGINKRTNIGVSDKLYISYQAFKKTYVSPFFIREYLSCIMQLRYFYLEVINVKVKNKEARPDEETKVKESVKLNEKDILELMKHSSYKRCRGAIRQVK